MAFSEKCLSLARNGVPGDRGSCGGEQHHVSLNGTAGLLARFGGFVRSISETHFLGHALDSGWETLSITHSDPEDTSISMGSVFLLRGICRGLSEVQRR